MSDPTVIPVRAATLGLRASTAAAAPRALYSIEVHTALDLIGAAWRTLETSGAASVFQRFEVFEAWTRTIAPGRATWHVAVVRRRPCERAVMLLPLALRDIDGLRVIEGADLEVSDFIGPVVAQDFRPSSAEMRSIWARVRAQLPHADAIRIAKMPALIGEVPNPMLLLKGVERFHLSNYRTRLRPDGQEWTDRIASKLKSDIAARKRKLGKRGKLEFRTAETEDEARRFFETMLAQRAERCSVMGRSNILEDDRYRAFYRSLLKPGRADSIGVMQALLVDDEIVATGYGLNGGTSFLMIFPTFAAQTWRNYSPGLQFFMESMGWAHRRGMAWYDFTIGGEGFKRDLAAEAEPLYEYLSARSLKGWPAICHARLRARLRQSRALRGLAERLRPSKA